MHMNKRVTGIGGILFKANAPDELREWYARHLGIESEEWGAVFPWRRADDPEKNGHTVWAPFKADTEYFAPSTAAFMINYRVDDLDGLLALLREEGVQVEDHIEESEQGRFAWIMDPDGNKVELWEPAEGM